MLVLDTSALIGAFDAHYLPDSIGAFWTFLDDAWQAGQVVVPHAVFEELRLGSGGARRWIARRRELVVDPSPEVQGLAGTIESNFNFRPGRDRADPFIIAEAKVRGFGVVTYEGMSPTGSLARASKKWSRIPEVCEALGVACFKPGEAWRHAGLNLT